MAQRRAAIKVDIQTEMYISKNIPELRANPYIKTEILTRNGTSPLLARTLKPNR